MNLPDTLVCDSQQLALFQGDEAFDYGRELHMPEQNVLEWLMDQLVRWVSRVFGGVLYDDNFRPWLYVLGGVIIVSILYFAYRNRKKIFRMERQPETGYQAEEDNIYGVDFPVAISKALAESDYRQAVRLRYLETLRWLADRELISWQIFKTPTQYVRELSSEHHDEFHRLTNHFIRVRYGNFAADRQLFDEMSRLAALVCSEADSRTEPIPTTVQTPDSAPIAGKEVTDER